MKIETRDIIIGDIIEGLDKRLRPLDLDHVADLIDDMKLRGQLDAIWVRALPKGKFKLLAGRHRLEAVEQLQDTIRADVWPISEDPVKAEAEDKAAEIVENLFRKDLTCGEKDLQTYLLLRAEEATRGALPVDRLGRTRIAGRVAKNPIRDRLAKELQIKPETFRKRAARGKAIYEAANAAGTLPEHVAQGIKSERESETFRRAAVVPCADRKAAQVKDAKRSMAKAVAAGVSPSRASGQVLELFDSRSPAMPKAVRLCRELEANAKKIRKLAKRQIEIADALEQGKESEAWTRTLAQVDAATERTSQISAATLNDAKAAEVKRLHS